jgi:hypothetical protein
VESRSTAEWPAAPTPGEDGDRRAAARATTKDLACRDLTPPGVDGQVAQTIKRPIAQAGMMLDEKPARP